MMHVFLGIMTTLLLGTTPRGPEAKRTRGDSPRGVSLVVGYVVVVGKV